MAVLFFDSSAVVKRYISESGSQWVTDVCNPSADNLVLIAVVSGAEVVAAFARRQREGGLTAEQASRAIAEFRDDWIRLYELVKTDRATVERAMLLAERHALRAYDAIQLACALEVNSITQRFGSAIAFASAD